MGDRKLPERAEVEAWETVLAERDRYREALDRLLRFSTSDAYGLEGLNARQFAEHVLGPVSEGK